MNSDVVLLIRTHPAASAAGLVSVVLVSIFSFKVARARPLWVATVAVSGALLPLSVGIYSGVRLLINGFRSMAMAGSGGLAGVAILLGEVRTVSLVGAAWGAIAAGIGSTVFVARARSRPYREPGADAPLSIVAKTAGWVAAAASAVLPLVALQDARVSGFVSDALWGAVQGGIGKTAEALGRGLILLAMMSYLGMALSSAILVLSLVGVTEPDGGDGVGPFRWASVVLPALCLCCVVSAAASASKRAGFLARASPSASAPLSFASPGPTPVALGPDVEAPILLSRIEAEYPDEARRAGVGGTIRVRFVVTAVGSVENVRIEQGGNQHLEVAAIAAVSQWRYRPAIRAGRRVPVELIADIPFPR